MIWLVMQAKIADFGLHKRINKVAKRLHQRSFLRSLSRSTKRLNVENGTDNQVTKANFASLETPSKFYLNLQFDETCSFMLWEWRPFNLRGSTTRSICAAAKTEGRRVVLKCQRSL